MKIDKDALKQTMLDAAAAGEIPGASDFNNPAIADVIATGIEHGLNSVIMGGTVSDKTSNFSLSEVVPAKHVLCHLVIENTTANPVTIDIGSTNGGNQIADDAVVPANDFLIVGSQYFFSKTAATTIYVSSAAWNSANINVSYNTVKVIE